MRKSLFSIGLAVLLSLTWSCTPKSSDQVDIWDFIPVRSAVVVEFNEGAKGFFQLVQHPFLDVPAHYPAGAAPLERLKELYPEGDVDDTWPMPEKLLMAVATAGADRFELAFLFEPGELGLPDLQKQLKVAQWTEQQYSTSSYLESANENGNWYLADIKGTWFLSTSRLLLEEALRKGEQTTPMEMSEGLERLVESADEGADLNIYLQYSEVASLWDQWFERSRLPDLQGVGNWMSIDLVLSPDRLLFSGVINEEADGLPAVLQGTRADEFTPQHHIPASVACWSSKQLSTIPEGKDWAPLRPAEEWLQERSVCGSFFLPVQRDGVFLLPVYYAGVEADQARELLPQDESIAMTTTVYRDVEIVELPVPLDLAPLFKFKRFSTQIRYFCVMDETVYFCQEADALKRVINELQAGDKLSNRYGNEPERHYPTGEANRHIGFQNPGFAHVLQHFVNGAGMPSISHSEEFINPIRSGGISLLHRSGRTYIKGSLNSGELNNSPIQNSWTIGLQDDVISGPHSVRSHMNGPHVFLVQDSTYTLYLVNLQGQIEWQTQLDGKILGTPYAIDRYKNDKYQYVLNTAGSLYGFDRLGRPLDGFPVKLEKAATAGLAVVDYDRGRNYRLLLPCGKTVLNYNAEGQVVKGWVFEAMNSDIKTSPLLLQSDQKDYLAFQSETSLRMADRTGKSRWTKDLALQLYPQNKWWTQITGNPKLDGFTGLNSKGKLVHVFLNGNVDSSQVEARWFRMFEGHAIRVNGHELEAQMPNGESFSTKRNGAQWQYVKPLLFHGNFYVLALDADQNALHLFNSKGQDLEGFPVYNEGDFTAGDFLGNGQLQIICTGSSGSLISYRVFANEE